MYVPQYTVDQNTQRIAQKGHITNGKHAREKTRERSRVRDRERKRKGSIYMVFIVLGYLRLRVHRASELVSTGASGWASLRRRLDMEGCDDLRLLRSGECGGEVK